MIGIFDSGIGGLTVMKRIAELLPRESIVYFGDTARIPYGPKSPAVVRRFSLEIGNYLVSLGAKVVVIACNTASSFGLSALSATLPVPVLGVVGPGADAAAAASQTGRIGIIGTRGTVASEAYQNAILAIRRDAKVFAAAAPLLVPLVEEGHLDDAFVDLALHRYIDPLLDKKIDTLVLGCTHYPLLEERIKAHVGSSVTVIDSALATARSLEDLLRESGLASSSDPPASGRIRYYCTDNPDGFSSQGKRFLGSPLRHVQLLKLEELNMGTVY
ncbi:MAG: glutamate racemase [Candidatus Hydrogenedentota bacterium]